MDFPTFETQRLKLVHIDHQYDQAYFDIMSEDKVTEYYGMDSLKKVNQASKIIDSFEDTYMKKHGIRWGIIWKETRTFIGTIGLNNLSTWSKRAEIGYELHPDHWRKGIATEAIRSVLGYSFREMGLFRMGAITFPDNVSSNNLLEKVGFKKEGILRGYLYQGDKSHDAYVFSMLRSEWLD
ncbi:GNAT family N-acetyltransferase [Virgibacillus phasianinus]|uniref:GNAT family N-acetyltransferase n=1 Tax=Virgibacillus phasianinus TaxID=2017483 RepID=A0A220TZ10_9BACI|nr:GNAT family N-acetyltransferase [Virgibacillus phasianinus]ASK61009.1 GNAT family N-acetyltransferase [Virgibacillus phasianinus]